MRHRGGKEQTQGQDKVREHEKEAEQEEAEDEPEEASEPEEDKSGKGKGKAKASPAARNHQLQEDAAKAKGCGSEENEMEDKGEDGMEGDDGRESLSAVVQNESDMESEVGIEGRRSSGQVEQEGEEVDWDGEAPRARKRVYFSLSPQTAGGKKSKCQEGANDQAEGKEEAEPADEVEGEQRSLHSHALMNGAIRTYAARPRRSNLNHVSCLFTCRRDAHGGARSHPEGRRGAPPVSS
jgi:hypothetical protein